MRRLNDAAALVRCAACAAALAAFATAAGGTTPEPDTSGQLRVCADAGNLPFSNVAGAGFENAIAEHLAARLGRELVYTWWPQRMGFVRNTLDAGKCDLVIGVPVRYDRVLTTRPYYCSGYAAVSAPRTAHDALDMQAWATQRIGVVERTPPLELLHRHDALGGAEVYPVIYDYDAYAPGAVVDAVARGRIDLALLWGPRAGPLAADAATPLEVTLLPAAAPAAADLPLRFAIAMGVRRDDADFAALLDGLLADEQAAIDAILERHHVPRLPLSACDAAREVGTTARRGGLLRVAATDSAAAENPRRRQDEGAARGAPDDEAGRSDRGAPEDESTNAGDADAASDSADTSDAAQAATAANTALGGDDGAAGSKGEPYRVENGKVDATTYQGWVRYAAFCERCHGPGALGSAAGPNLLDRLEGTTKAHFEAIVTYGLEGDFGVMPAWQNNPNVMPYLDNLWAWLSARIDGALDAGRPTKLDAGQAAVSKEEPSS